MKKTALLRVLLFALLVSALTAGLCSCGGKDKDVVGLVVEYTGPEITSTEHKFTEDEFHVIAAYLNKPDKELTSRDFKVGLESLNEGVFTVKVTYRGFEQYVYVKCSVPVYPSELGGNS